MGCGSVLQLAYAAVTLLVYAWHFGWELLSCCGGQAGRTAARTASQKAAAVLDYSLAATAPDDPPTDVPPPVAAELPTRAAAADADVSRCEDEGAYEDDLSVEQGAEGWELLSKRSAPDIDHAGVAHAELAATKARLSGSSGAGKDVKGRHQGLRQRGAGKGSSSTHEEPPASASGAGGPQQGPGGKGEADDASKDSSKPLRQVDVLWMCAIFTLQVWADAIHPP